MEVCKKCGVSFDTKFCQPCRKVYKAKYDAENVEKNRVYREWYMKENEDKVKESKVAWRAANRDHEKKYSSMWYRENRGRKAKANAAWYAENKDRLLAKSAAYREANLDSYRVHAQNRDARIRANGGKLSIGLAAKLTKLQKGLCACCKKPLGADYHLDHIMPIALGGANEDWNIQLLRGVCNMQKHVKHPVDFMQSKGYLL